MKKRKHLCPICGQYEFPEQDSLDICDTCGWQDDLVQEKDPDYRGGANRMSLNEAKTAWEKSGGKIPYPYGLKK